MTTLTMLLLTGRGTNGFWGPATPSYAIFTVGLEVLMGLGLLVGAVLARLDRFRAHAWCQASIVLLNVVLIVLVMIPSFQIHVVPRLPERLNKSFYLLATIHAAFGAGTEVAGLYLLLAAGTNFLPEPFRLVNYKLWMRAVLVSWWVVILLGIATYLRWYEPALFGK